MDAKSAYKTAINRKDISAPLKWLLKNNWLHPAYRDLLDYGCGYGKDVEVLDGFWWFAEGYDPNPERGFVKNLSRSKNKYDYILCTYVLNVVSYKEQQKIMKTIKRLLKPAGQAFVSVRRDVPENGTGTQRYVKLRNSSLYHKKNAFEIYLVER